MTSLRGGVRVPKDDIRVEANGSIDLLNALIGKLRVMPDISDDWKPYLQDIQKELMTVMSHLATPDGSENPRELHAAEITSQLERAIDQANFQGGFVVPGGGSALSAFIHLARTQARTVERRLWSLNREHPVGSAVLVMMNRLSDYLFVLSNEKE